MTAKLVSLLAALLVAITGLSAYVLHSGPATPVLGAVAQSSPGPEFCIGQKCTYVVPITQCFSASTTLFSVRNPYGTSTVRLLSMQVGGNATSSTLVVGTSTVAAAGATTPVPSLIIAASSTGLISTSTVFWTSSGNTVGGVGGVNNGFLAAGAGSQTSIMVKPGEYVQAYSTTTAASMGVQYAPGQPVCNFELEFSK